MLDIVCLLTRLLVKERYMKKRIIGGVFLALLIIATVWIVQFRGTATLRTAEGPIFGTTYHNLLCCAPTTRYLPLVAFLIRGAMWHAQLLSFEIRNKDSLMTQSEVAAYA